MSNKRYGNFVRPSSPTVLKNPLAPSLSGEDVSRIYLEEIQEARSLVGSIRHSKSANKAQKTIKNAKLDIVSKKDLFVSVQNNDVQTLKQILDTCPNMLNTTDEYGWSLLMIACQANSVDAARELLNRGINTSVRDKAGNSARSLVIKNKNLILVDILLSHKSSQTVTSRKITKSAIQKPGSVRENYFCEICNKEFSNKDEHLSSTVHNIDASKGKKIPSGYVIPSSNKGYQIMLKVGWDRECGLGPDGSGKKYPIKTVQKKDRKGLGLDKRKEVQEEKKETVKHVNRKLLERECKNSKSMEINFRREFY